MKKIALLLTIVILGTAAFAAPTKVVVVKKVAPAPVEMVSTPAPMAKATGSSMQGRMAIGTSLGFATLKMHFNDDFAGSLGLNNISAGGVSQTGYLLRVDYNLAKVGEVQPCLGAFYTTNGAAAATTIFGVVWGVSTMVQSNLSLGADVWLFGSLQVARVSGTGILPGVSLAANYYF